MPAKKGPKRKGAPRVPRTAPTPPNPAVAEATAIPPQTPPGERTGLGLAAVYGILRQNGGAIDVASELGRGTNFTIWLSRIVDHAHAAPGGGTAQRGA